MSHPLDLPNLLILDSETTGLKPTDEIIELTVINPDGVALIDTLIKPSQPIPQDATDIHGISNDDVKDAPTWADIYPQLVGLQMNHTLGIYNASFDIQLIQQSCHINRLAFQPIEHSFCLMRWYAEFWGDMRPDGNYQWQSLVRAADQQGVYFDDLTPHRALSDCELTRRLLLKTK